MGSARILQKELVLNEEKLLDSSFRNNPEKLAELIGDGCIGITETGMRDSFTPGESFSAVDGVLYIDSNSVRLVDLADDCKLLLYTGTRVKKNTRTNTNCSSIWKQGENGWQIVFHQRTLCMK